jgi:hypothetical protein
MKWKEDSTDHRPDMIDRMSGDRMDLSSDLKMLTVDNKSESESEVIITKNSGKEKDQEGGSSETVNRQTETAHSEASHPRIPVRERKIPVTRSKDFLW